MFLRESALLGPLTHYTTAELSSLVVNEMIVYADEPILFASNHPLHIVLLLVDK